MPIPAEELGVKTSKPIEIYDFVVGSTTYRYTSYEIDVIYGGNTYFAVAIERSALGIVPQGDGSDVIVKVDITTAFVQANTGVPEVTMTGMIRRIQNGVAWMLTRGPISPLVLVGEDAEVRIGQLTDDPLRVNVPSFLLGKSCGHVVYEGLCQSQRTDHDFVTTVVSVDGVEMVVTSINSHPDGWYNDGEIQIGTVKRYIVKQVGTTLTLLQPFGADVDGGESCTLYDGCTRAIEDCRDRHNQVENFGGAPYLDPKNPFVNRLAWE